MSDDIEKDVIPDDDNISIADEDEKLEQQILSIDNIDIMETMLNKTSQEYAIKHIGEGYNFSIHLLPATLRAVKYDIGFEVEMVAGVTVKLYVRHFRGGYTFEDKAFIPTIRDCIRQIPRLQRSSALDLRSRILKRNRDSRKFTSTINQSILPLLPSYRYNVEITHTVKVTDTITNESVTLSGNKRIDDLEEEARLILGRRIKMLEQKEIEKVENGTE